MDHPERTSGSCRPAPAARAQAPALDSIAGEFLRDLQDGYVWDEEDAEARATIRAGDVVTVPGPADRFKLTISPPAGKNRLLAIVIPAGVWTDDLVAAHDDMQPIDDLADIVGEIAGRTAKGIQVDEAPKNRAVGVREYEIVE